MTEETAKKLIEALDRHSAALEKLSGLGGGIQHYYYGAPSPQYLPQQPYYHPYQPPWGPTCIGGAS